MATDAAFPIDTAAAGAEIKQLIEDNGIESLTSKIIRKHLEAKFNCQLTDFKAEIDRLTMEKIQEKQTKSSPNEDKSSSEDEIEDLSPVKTNLSSKNKKNEKRAASEEADDMVSSVKRRRACVNVKQRREPAAKKKKADADAPNSRKGKSAFSRICVLSDELSNILGQKYMRRSDVVKAMWAYFRERNLMDPKDRRMVILNDALKKVFPGKRIQAFGMMKGLKTHIKDADFLDDETRRQMELDFEAAESNNAMIITATSSGAKDKPSTEPTLKKGNVQSDDESSNSHDQEEEEIVKADAPTESSNFPDIEQNQEVYKNGQDKNPNDSPASSSSSADSSSSSNSSDNE